MKINPSIFHAYDIRGKYPEEISEDLSYAIGRTFALFLQKGRKKKVVVGVGRDMRLSSPLLFREFVKGILEQGCSVVDLGMITTPMLYFAVLHFAFDGGAVISASHNPNPYNGIKLTREKAIPLGGETGIFWIRDFILQNQSYFSKKGSKRGTLRKKNIEDEYVRFNVKLAKLKRDEYRGFSVALDAGNGMGGSVAMKILKIAGVTVFPLYIKPDGNFPHHGPDPLLKENLQDLQSLVRTRHPSFGVALDGDADRIIFIDEKGFPIAGDIITALIAKIILQNRPFQTTKKIKILCDIRSSNVVRETVLEKGGIPIQWKVGHAYIKEKMRRDNVLFAGEVSGHYYWGHGFFFEVPFLALLKILSALKKSKIPFSALVSPLKKYFHSGEINFKVHDKKRKMEEIKKAYARVRLLTLDGLRADFKDWWFLVRPSNTEPVLRLAVEAKTEQLLKEKTEELTRLLME